MTKGVAILAGSLLAASCTGPGPSRMEQYSREALELCTNEAEYRAIDLQGPVLDRVSLYALAETAWLYFSHGDAGTSDQRSADYRLLLVCGVENGPPMNIVFMGQLFEDPVIDEPGRDYFVSPAGTTEVLYERVNGRFEYCCSRQLEE